MTDDDDHDPLACDNCDAPGAGSVLAREPEVGALFSRRVCEGCRDAFLALRRAEDPRAIYVADTEQPQPDLPWDPALWPDACPRCGHEHDPESYWYSVEPREWWYPFGVNRVGLCWQCGFPHPVLGKIRAPVTDDDVAPGSSRSTEKTDPISVKRDPAREPLPIVPPAPDGGHQPPSFRDVLRQRAVHAQDFLRQVSESARELIENGQQLAEHHPLEGRARVHAGGLMIEAAHVVALEAQYASDKAAVDALRVKAQALLASERPPDTPTTDEILVAQQRGAKILGQRQLEGSTPRNKQRRR